MQLSDHRDRQQDAFAAIVFAAVAHGVVMRAGQQRLGVRIIGQVASDYVADRVDPDLHAGIRHPVGQLTGGVAVRVGHIGAGQHAVVVAPAGKGFGPGQDRVAQLRHMAQQCVQAQFRDAADLAQAFGQLVGRLIAQAAGEGADDGLARQSVAIRPLDREDEGEAEFGVVCGVQFVQRREFFRAALVQSGLGLFAARFHGQLTGQRRLARQFRMGADQAQLLGCACVPDHRLQRQFQRRQRGERALRRCALRYPRRMFVNAVQGRGKAGSVAGIELGEGGGHVHLTYAENGCTARQCCAISMRRVIQTWSCACT